VNSHDGSSRIVTRPEVPVLVLTGPVGVGKSTVASEAARLLREAHVSYALADLQHLGNAWPPPPDDQWNERVIHRNLACMWSNFRAAGASRLILCRVLECRSLLRHIADAVPGSKISVVRLRAPLDVLHTRLRARDHPRAADWYLNVATYLFEKMEQSRVEDYLVDIPRVSVVSRNPNTFQMSMRVS
jgi:tRNA uridine 5-carbamoylmethylation protein Kti12